MTLLERRIFELCSRAFAYADKTELQKILAELNAAIEEHKLQKGEPIVERINK